MKENKKKSWILITGFSLLSFWFFGGILPYLLHKSKWESYSYGDKIDWVKDDSFVFGVYYLFGILGIWEWLLITSLLFFYLLAIKGIKNRILFLLITSIYGFIMGMLIALNRNCVNPVMRVLE